MIMAERTAAYQYGRVLGVFQEGYRRMFEDIARGMADVARETLRSRDSVHNLMMSDPDYRRERASEMVYEAKVAREKTLARLYLKNLIRKERNYWGLDEPST